MEKEKIFFVRCRGIILHEGKMLVVKHSENADYYALPGGGLEWGENPIACMTREIVEELGIAPTVGPLLYVHSWTDKEKQHIEFFFQIENAVAYLDTAKLRGTHSSEIFEIRWAEPSERLNILPPAFGEDFNTGKLNRGGVKFI